MIRVLTLFAFLALLPQVSKHTDTDRIELANGKVLQGRVVYEDDETVLFRQSRKKPREYARKELKSVQSLERSMKELLERYDEVDKTNAAALGEVAGFAKERGLIAEGKALWVAALFADPDYRPAYEALEARESSKKGWQFKIGKKWKTLDEAKAIQGKWREHWEVETTHFVIRTDLPVERLTNLVMNVERYYLDYYELMHNALPLQVFDALPKVNLYVEEGTMPKPPVPGDAWFDWARNELDLEVIDDVNMALVMSEMTRLMLFNSLWGTIGKSGRTPPWCGRGLADIFGAAVDDSGKVLKLDFDREYTDFFRIHAKAAEPFQIKNLLGMGWGAFNSGTNHELARAQVYTLTHFLVFGADEKYRPGFGVYLREAYVGKGSETHFEKALDLEDTKDLEAAWHAYAKAKAGA